MESNKPASRPTFIPKRSDLFTKTIDGKTLNAWEPFYDCVHVNFELQNSDVDDEHPEWRVQWVFGVAMLRTVGHVLAKVDGAISAKHSNTIKAHWERWKSAKSDNWIFWEFIEEERNNILNTYKFGVDIDKHGLWHDELSHDGIQLMREATYWWRHQLISIENALSI